MTRRALVLIDGEHYPPVVRAAIAAAERDDRVVAALLLGGSEKLRAEPDYGLPLERAGGDAGAAMLAAAHKHAADRVIDLSDEPVLTEAGRFRLISRALAAGLSYRGPDFEFWPPPRPAAGVPAIAVIGTGKRIGKTAVCGQVARVLGERHRVVLIAMGRGGPEQPEVVDGAAAAPSVDDLLRRSRAGQHAASDFLEDAALARVAAVGARRCGGGLAGAPFMSNVDQALEVARGLDPELLLLEGSGAAVPPAAADRTILVTSASRPAETLRTGLGPYRVLVADVVVITMSEAPLADAGQVASVRAAIAELRPQATVIPTVLRPVPAEPVAGEPVALFTTASAPIHRRLAEHLAHEHGAEVTAVIGSLGNRAALRGDLDAPGVLAASTYLIEIKAAAIDVVAEAARERGARVVFCDNRPQSLPGEPGLDEVALGLAAEVVAVGA
jgi:cyclic 2,3-diphosphoglycerate synthetase